MASAWRWLEVLFIGCLAGLTFPHIPSLEQSAPENDNDHTGHGRAPPMTIVHAICVLAA
eukprot:CAMPEP_0183484266 /NCGR_PEP_ID=MMETSP0370-20130417/178836_1 /TAXON_ID=268820 /ORGANISM="Peridinium aciculiferum, Strain PAER-2" /LENGTH=58 /DNA_ID=CAMNT_0025677557 /DNA_START=365 /DNA_END=541 /DNA_ORIENTATION=+